MMHRKTEWWLTSGSAFQLHKFADSVATLELETENRTITMFGHLRMQRAMTVFESPFCVRLHCTTETARRTCMKKSYFIMGNFLKLECFIVFANGERWELSTASARQRETPNWQELCWIKTLALMCFTVLKSRLCRADFQASVDRRLLNAHRGSSNDLHQLGSRNPDEFWQLGSGFAWIKSLKTSRHLKRSSWVVKTPKGVIEVQLDPCREMNFKNVAFNPRCFHQRPRWWVFSSLSDIYLIWSPIHISLLKNTSLTPISKQNISFQQTKTFRITEIKMTMISKAEKPQAGPSHVATFL